MMDWINGWDTAAQADQESGSKALPNDVATTKGLGEQLAELNAKLERQGAVQNANTRAQRDAIRKQIAEQDFPEILKAVDDNIDVAEELARLRAHLDEIQRLLKAGGELGKRLDFLVQELLREANTLASKAASLELTNISVEMKVAIEQLREQVQNIE